MKDIHVPAINARYWVAILMASMFGTNLGDLYANESGLGLFLGVSLLGLIALGVFLAERRDTVPRELYYWTVIILIRTSATNIADDTRNFVWDHAERNHYKINLIAWLELQDLLLSLLLAAALVVLGWLAMRRRVSASSAMEDASLPATGIWYWAAMLAAGIFGTLVGDISSGGGLGEGAVVLTLLYLVSVAIWYRYGFTTFWPYWVAIAAARMAGTLIGDWLAGDPVELLGLPLATVCTGTVFVATLIFWQGKAAGREPKQSLP